VVAGSHLIYAQTYKEAARVIQETISNDKNDISTEKDEAMFAAALKERKREHIAEKHVVMYKSS